MQIVAASAAGCSGAATVGCVSRSVVAPWFMWVFLLRQPLTDYSFAGRRRAPAEPLTVLRPMTVMDCQGCQPGAEQHQLASRLHEGSLWWRVENVKVPSGLEGWDLLRVS
ncbi:hypothetical protein, partial [Micromonospora sp. NPDC005806]|uniref:hypothetical protein n=1 Tax=Micromonospora sp. NPDC005806 TaxID=3364234 RepID=UPI00368D910E